MQPLCFQIACLRNSICVPICTKRVLIACPAGIERRLSEQDDSREYAFCTRQNVHSPVLPKHEQNCGISHHIEHLVRSLYSKDRLSQGLPHNSAPSLHHYNIRPKVSSGEQVAACSRERNPRAAELTPIESLTIRFRTTLPAGVRCIVQLPRSRPADGEIERSLRRYRRGVTDRGPRRGVSNKVEMYCMVVLIRVFWDPALGTSTSLLYDQHTDS